MQLWPSEYYFVYSFFVSRETINYERIKGCFIIVFEFLFD